MAAKQLEVRVGLNPDAVEAITGPLLEAADLAESKGGIGLEIARALRAAAEKIKAKLG